MPLLRIPGVVWDVGGAGDVVIFHKGGEGKRPQKFLEAGQIGDLRQPDTGNVWEHELRALPGGDGAEQAVDCRAAGHQGLRT